MSDPLIIQTLKQKRAEISGVIAAYQAKIAQARHDLAHINAVVRLVEGGEQERAQYIVSHGFFKKGEIADICLRGGEHIPMPKIVGNYHAALSDAFSCEGDAVGFQAK